MKLHYAGLPGIGYGWGVCNSNLIRELNKLCEWTGSDFDSRDVVFMPLADHDFNPATSVRGRVNLAYTFFEYPLGPNAVENAKKYDVVFVGSTWCKERCAERGILNTEVLIQGVDHEIFSPAPPRPPDGQFRIFSGGKFEYRKGHDLVIAAFREFSKTHPEAHLVCAWFNPWPHLINASLPQMDTIARTTSPYQNQDAFFSALISVNGIHPSRFTILPKLDQREMAIEMRNTDIGLFPNRCEGGTNLVLMEYAATGNRVVANLGTGHRDIQGMVDDFIHSNEDADKWAFSSVDQITRAIERAMAHGERPADHPVLTWRAAAEKIVATAERCLYQSVNVESDDRLGVPLHRTD